MDPTRANNTTVPRSTTAPVDSSGSTLPHAPPRSLPIESRFGSMMAPSMNIGWGYQPMQGAELGSSRGKEPMVDAVTDSTRNPCITDVHAVDAITAKILKPGGLVESLLRSATSNAIPSSAASKDDFFSELFKKATASTLNASLDGVIGNETSVMIIFDGAFTHNTVLQTPFASANLLNLLPQVKITGSSMVEFPVCVDYRDGVTRFSEGWLDFVAAEKIVMGGMGLFMLSSRNKLKMMLYDSKGVEKPMNKRPQTWNLFIAYNEEFGQPTSTPPMGSPMTSPLESPISPAAPTPTPGNNHFIVLEHVREMRYNLGPRLFMSDALVERLAHVWLNYRTDYPLYAATMIKSHLTTGIFYFSTAVSEMLPLMPKDVTIYWANAADGVKGKLKKRFSDGLARITKGWRLFIRIHSVQLNDVYVFCLRNTRSVLGLRVFPVAMA